MRGRSSYEATITTDFIYKTGVSRILMDARVSITWIRTKGLEARFLDRVNLKGVVGLEGGCCVVTIIGVAQYGSWLGKSKCALLT